MKLLAKRESELSEEEILAIERLIFATWPPKNEKVLTEAALLEDYKKRTPGKTSFLLLNDHELIGYAETFVRKIITEDGPLSITGLGAVCVNSTHRGKGLGARIVAHIFKKISQSEVPVCLFQTAVPGFYEKMNCRKINNTFYNSLDLKSPQSDPFWDPYRMIFPKDFLWPNGKIDLNGKGF